MKYFESLDFKLSRGFKNSVAKELLDAQLEKEPYSFIKYFFFKDYSYDLVSQGVRYNYQVGDTGDKVLTMTLGHDILKKIVIFELKKCGNISNIIIKEPRKDTRIFHIRHNTDGTVTSLSRRIRNFGTNSEKTVESRYSLFDSSSGSMLDYSEELPKPVVLESRNQLIKLRNVV